MTLNLPVSTRDEIPAELRARGFAESFSMAPLPKQQAFVCSPKPRVAYIGGLGAGKTIAGALRALVAIIQNPYSHGLIVAPTLDLAKIAYRDLEALNDALLAQTGKSVISYYNKGLHEAHTPWGRIIFIRSATLAERSLRGHKMGWAWMDESQEMARPEDVLQLCLARLRCPQAEQRSLWLTTTPHRGMVGAVKKLADLRATHPEMVAVYRATTMDNPYLPEDYIESLRLTYSKRRWAAEVEAKILRGQDVVYPEFDREKHVVPWVSDPDHRWILMADWGLRNPHFLVVEEDELDWIDAKGKKHSKPLYVIVDEYCPSDGEAIERQNAWILDLQRKRCAPRLAGVDAHDYWRQLLLLRRFGWRVKSYEDERVLPSIEIVRSCLDPLEGPPRLFLSEQFVEQSRKNERGIYWCLQNYRWHTDKTGTALDTPRHDQFSHGIDALRYGLLAAGETYYQRTPGFSAYVAPHTGLLGHDREE